MRIHDDFDALVRHSGGRAKAKDAQSDVGHALANPRQASVQTMLEVQRLAGNAGVSKLLQRDEEPAAQRSPVLDVVGKGGGQPLDTGLRSEMEGRLGADFSDVKVHTDNKASESAKAVQANAYTVGSDVVVRQDRWSPSTDQGKETIAHELTHVIQQRAGPVAGTPTGDGISVSDPGDRFERAADATAKSVMAGPAPAPGAGGGGASAQLEADHALQRSQSPDAALDEEAQMQRDEEPVEEAQMQRQEEEPVEEAQMQRDEEPAEEAQMQRQDELEEEEPSVSPQLDLQRQAGGPEEEEPAAP